MKKIILGLAVLTFAFAASAQGGDDKPKAPADPKAPAVAKDAASDAKTAAPAPKTKESAACCDGGCDDAVKPLMSPRDAATR